MGVGVYSGWEEYKLYILYTLDKNLIITAKTAAEEEEDYGIKSRGDQQNQNDAADKSVEKISNCY